MTKPSHHPQVAGSNGGKSQALLPLKIGVSLLLLAYVVWKGGLDSAAGRDRLCSTLRGADPFWIGVSIVVGVLLTVISSWKWQTLLRSKGIRVGLGRLVAIYFIGRFFNMFLPTSMGGDVVRAWEVGRHSGERCEAAASVLVERLSGMATLVFVAAAAVLTHAYGLPILTGGVLFLAAANLAVLWLILDQRILPWLSKFLQGRLALADGILTKMGRLQQAVREYKDRPWVLVQVFAISCLFYFMAVVNVWSTAKAFHSDVAFMDMLLAVPAIMLVMNIPLSIGGIGLMEAAFAFFFPLFGHGAALAVSTALFMRLKNLIYGAAGGLVHLGRLRADSRTRRAA